MRVDIWVWAVRMVKTRSQGSKMCTQGNVLVNGEKCKPAKKIKIGDIIEVEKSFKSMKYEVMGFINKPNKPEKVAEFFRDLLPKTEEQKPVKSSGYRKEIREKTKKLKTIQKKKYRKDQGKITKKDRRTHEKFIETEL